MIHFDSHTDTWDTYYDEKYWHGSPFIRAYEEGLVGSKEGLSNWYQRKH